MIFGGCQERANPFSFRYAREGFGIFKPLLSEPLRLSSFRPRSFQPLCYRRRGLLSCGWGFWVGGGGGVRDRRQPARKMAGKMEGSLSIIRTIPRFWNPSHPHAKNTLDSYLLLPSFALISFQELIRIFILESFKLIYHMYS